MASSKTLHGLLLASLLALAPACRLPGASPADAVPEVADEFVDSANLALEALDLGDDELAASVLLRMRALGPDAGTAAWIAEVERVLAGRAQVDRLDLALDLEAYEVDGAKGKRLVLEVRAGPGPPLVLDMTPPLLSWEREWLSAEGHGGRTNDAVGLDRLERIELAPDAVTRIPIMDLPPTRGQAAAARERWLLEMHFCYLTVEGTRYSTNAPRVRPLDRYLLASQLRLGALAPDSLAQLLAERPDAPMAMVVERTVRVLPEHHEAALDALTPVVLELTQDEVGRIAASLQWLTGGARARGEYHGEAGDLAAFLSPEDERPLVTGGRLLDPALLYGHPRAWMRWLEARAVLRARKPASPLDLPDQVREATALTEASDQP